MIHSFFPAPMIPEKKYILKYPRLPLEGKLDLTYRCNNNCRHCWLWLSKDSSQARDELTFDQLCSIVDQARNMGCQVWRISGGEPMLRPDFFEIFDYITKKSVTYSLNTNATLITPTIAKLLKRRGNKMVALYGATAEIHDYVTRTPGSFEAMMRGIAYLKEAKVNFIVQIIPMRANQHQYEAMLALAESISPYYRIGAAWLFMSANHSIRKNFEIKNQRLNPEDVIKLDEPNPLNNSLITSLENVCVSEEKPCLSPTADDRLFAKCIPSRRDFHIDPYGKMSFCCFIKDPSLRFDLRKGEFIEAWDNFIPSLIDIVHGGQEYQENCGSCNLRKECRWCPVYGYLENGRYSAKVEYLCHVAKANKKFKDDWKMTHLKYYTIAGITIQVSANFPLTDSNFNNKFLKFKVDGPGEDTIAIQYVSSVPPISELSLGQEVYHRPPWAIYQQRNSYVYLGLRSDTFNVDNQHVSIIADDFSHMTIYNSSLSEKMRNQGSLTTYPSDQILLSQLLANRGGCYIHASGLKMFEKGFLFVGHSGAGKSTMLKMLREHGEILCDDRIILRHWPEGFKIHGTWSHGELPDVSPSEAPLRAIFFLEKATINELVPIINKKEMLGKVLSHIIRPLVTKDWWEKTMALTEKLVNEIPMYALKFDKSGRVIDVLNKLK